MPGISLQRYAEAQDIEPGRFRFKFWIWGEEVYYDRFQLDKADAATFGYLNETWACDAKHVYCEHARVTTCDYATFETLNRLFARDKNAIYTINGRSKKADAASFEVLDRGNTPVDDDDDEDGAYFCGYARDAANVYFLDTSQGDLRVVRGADRDHFRVLKFGYATDDRKVFDEGYVIQGADPATFKPLNGNYGKDAEHVYYGRRLLEAADANSFRAVNAVTGKDKRATYKYGRERKVRG